ncbi:Sodium-dependent phosphate transporter [Salisediminibacterium beveridgei]|uniref:Sodium-dependent phosphate transporter n=2 Tax=Salisediminibacterium beveridgei TaxID=632773 RepID=A0A1D7QUD6_9BACI|nr:Na/Pi cotransporter family protein [Salisediminibacterium beveridgei]AOM82623.1 Sodium-dependent phosphate transporter [Salisediminibacterium beveridgei]
MEIGLQELLFMFFGGLAIFLFGIKYMGDGLQLVAGDRLRELLDKYTSNPLMGVIAGIVVTILLQTSTGTTVLAIGLVNAGFMKFRQAIGVIMGANIGTTITAFIIGLKISEYALPIIAVGTFLIFFLKNKKANNYGQVIFGFGALFYGLNLMGDGLRPLRDLDVFVELTLNMSTNPLLGVLIGTIFTVSVQSSSAAIGLLQQLYAQGAMDLPAALPVLFGDNIGTTITAVLASLGASLAAKRAALTHVIFNVVGTIIVLIFVGPYIRMMEFLEGQFNLNPEMTIAVAHGIFNVTNVMIQLPFIGFLAWIVIKILPGKESVIEFNAQNLDPTLINQSSSIALGQAKKETLRMAQLSAEGLKEALNFVETKQKKSAELTYQFEDAVNNLDKKITDYLVRISTNSLTAADSRLHSVLLDTVRDIERVGDHMENIVELAEYQVTNKVKLSDEAMTDIRDMFTYTLDTLDKAIESLDKDDTDIAKEVMEMEEKIDKMERKYRKKHIIRLNEGLCEGSAGIIFADMISNLERIGDHSVNIAETVINE